MLYHTSGGIPHPLSLFPSPVPCPLRVLLIAYISMILGWHASWSHSRPHSAPRCVSESSHDAKVKPSSLLRLGFCDTSRFPSSRVQYPPGQPSHMRHRVYYTRALTSAQRTNFLVGSSQRYPLPGNLTFPGPSCLAEQLLTKDMIPTSSFHPAPPDSIETKKQPHNNSSIHVYAWRQTIQLDSTNTNALDHTESLPKKKTDAIQINPSTRTHYITRSYKYTNGLAFPQRNAACVELKFWRRSPSPVGPLPTHPNVCLSAS